MNVHIDMKKMFDALGKEQKQMLVLAVVGTVAILFGYFNLLLLPQISGTVKAAAKSGKLASDLKQAASDIAKTEAFRADIRANSEKIAKYGDTLPSEEGIPSLLESLSDMARGSGMRILGIVPAGGGKDSLAQKGQAYRALPIMISARAGFHELGRFMSTLENSGRFMKVSDIRVRENKTSPKKHDIDLTVMTYVLIVGK